MSARGGKFLRPADNSQFDDAESSDDDSSDESDDEAPPPTNSSSNPKTSANLSSDEEPSKKRPTAAPTTSAPPKKKKKTSQSFFDEEAEAEGENSDEEEDVYGAHKDPHDRVLKHYTEEDIQREQMDEEAKEIMRQQDRRRAQAGGRSRFLEADDASVAELARDIESRHRMDNRRVDYRRPRVPNAPQQRKIYDKPLDSVNILEDPQEELEDPRVEMGGPENHHQVLVVDQQSLVPSVSDPSLWMFGCLPGKEQELVIQIMNKAIAAARRSAPLGITSVVAAQTKGKIYIESYSEPSVMEAVQGVRGLLLYTMQLVPISDMTTVLNVVPKKKPVKIHDWVRMTRGHYKGDLALVRDLNEGGLKCVIQCVPRLDLTLHSLSPEEQRVRRKTVRPPQKFFSASEIGSMGLHFTREKFKPMGDMPINKFDGQFYDEGYLVKQVSVHSMVRQCGDDDPPTLDELQRFRKNKQRSKEDHYDEEEEEENEGSKIAKSLLDELSELQGKSGDGKSSSQAGLVVGDTVEVVEGDLVGLRGKLLSMDGNNTVKIKPDTTNVEDLGDTNEIDFLASQVMKYIPVGSHVKVIDGRYSNETGTVVAVERMENETDCTAVVLTDMTHKEISVRTSQLQESAEIASGQDKLAGYELHDLVVLSGGGSNNEVGVIVRVGREEFTCINNHGNVREVRPEELRGKRNSTSNRAVALDAQGNQIRVNDLVSIADGPFKGRQATIKRMNRAQLFLYSQTRTENAGIFVVRSRSCVLSGQKGKVERGAAAGGAFGGRGGKGKKEDGGLIGKTVRIQSGQWKGYLGCVADTTATHVTVELHSRLKKVQVMRERVVVAGDKFGATDNPDRTMSDGTGGGHMMAPTTPFLGGATPMHGGATPMHGGATPMHDGGGFTPAHNNENSDDVWRPGGDIDRTPMRDDNDLDNVNNQNKSSPNEDSGWGGSAAVTDMEDDDKGDSDPQPNTDDGPSGGSGWGSGAADQGNTWEPTTSTNDEGGNIGSNGGNDGGRIPSVVKSEPMRPVVNNNSNSTGSSRIENATAGNNAENDGEAAVWFMERVCVGVTLKGSGPTTAIIKEIINSDNTVSALLELPDRSTEMVSPNQVTLILPKEEDMVLVTGGADVGVEGKLVCIDGSDAILKDSNEDFKIVDFCHLAKIEGDS